MTEIVIDKRVIEAEEGKTLLEVCLDNDIYIPNLCYISGQKEAPASCRLCFVQIKGDERPVTSCNLPVEEGMEVSTDTPVVRALQKAALRLLLSVHDVDCGNCPANKRCELQRIASFLGIGLKPKGLDRSLQKTEIDRSHPFFDYYLSRCVLCGRCVRICRSRFKQPVLTFAGRGFESAVSSYGSDAIEDIPCPDCRACEPACPVGAIVWR